ncbi:MAG TPA: TolC family protein, partial [Candidatus Acidoferrum sp.]
MTRFGMKNASRSRTLPFVIAAGAFFIAGCNVGPRYKRPAYAAPESFRGADNAPVVSGTQNSLGDEKWSEVFREPELKTLIQTALVNNYDVRIAAQRVLEQQAQVQITRSQEFPQITGGGTA